MELTGPELRQLNQALGRAYMPTTFAQMLLYYTNRPLQNYAAIGTPMPTILFDVTTAAQAEGWLTELINGARQDRPRSEDIAAFAERIGVSSLVPELEARIRTELAYLDIASFLDNLTRIESQVGQVAVAEGPTGTGFLLGPDVLMTNHHVLAPVIAGTRQPQHVTIRFDYRKATDGSELPGKKFSLAESADWLLDSSPPLPGPGGAPAANDRQLDYALVRLKEQAGSDEVRIDETSAPVARGWVAMPDPVPDLAADAPLSIVQHPEGGSLKLALESKSVVGLVADGVRLRHRTNTDPGSSGSPCFNDAWKLVALHNAADPARPPTWNEAVPMTEIRSQLAARDKLGLLGSTA